LTGYYRKFVKNYGRIVAPLTTLLKKDAFSWIPEATKAFEHLKEAMCQAMVLATLDFTKTFIVECDASGNGIGVALMQDERPISFESRPIKGKFLHKAIYEKEMLAILHALKKWRPYLMGRHFKVKMDHDMLEYYILQSNGTHKILQKYKHIKHTKQERHRYTWFTQFCLRLPLTTGPSFLLSSKMKRHNLQQIHCNILCFLSQSHLSISCSRIHIYFTASNTMPSYKERGCLLGKKSLN